MPRQHVCEITKEQIGTLKLFFQINGVPAPLIRYPRNTDLPPAAFPMDNMFAPEDLGRRVYLNDDGGHLAYELERLDDMEKRAQASRELKSDLV